MKNINLRYLYKTYILIYYENKKDGEIFALFWNQVLSRDFGYSLHTTHYTTILINVINGFFRLLKYLIILYLG